MNDEALPFPPPRAESKDYYTVMAHFYRGEIGRIMVWRQRLDVTTNWAIVAATGITTFAIGHEECGHIAFLFANLLVLLLLVIEARRYRYYDAFRARVRMLEAHLITPVLMADAALLQGDWRKTLAEDLLEPAFKISRWEAICRRFRRNYRWIFLILFSAWFLKAWMLLPPPHTWRGFVAILESRQPLPPWMFWSALAGLAVALLWLNVASLFFQDYSGEFRVKPMRGRRMMI
jgi:uncharacterized membrane protein